MIQYIIDNFRDFVNDLRIIEMRKQERSREMAEFSFQIEEHLLVLSENDKGWTKELNRVSFNGAPAKYDLRTWSPDHTKMGKGITLTNEEFQVMLDAFKQ